MRPSTSQIPIYNAIHPLRTLRSRETLANRTIGFIPTMGALHDGHLSLMRHAAKYHPTLVVSIFVNPAQFAPHEDFAAYPRTLSADMEKLETLNAQLSQEDPSGETLGRISAVFNPTASQMYPRGIPLDVAKQKGAFVTVDPLAQRFEGVTRPHFFRGVATVCTKLFNIVQPDAAYFGQKDVQQTIVLKTLVEDLCFNIRIAVVPTGRDPLDGLALSSRNVFLGETRRRYAGCLYAALSAAKRQYDNGLKAGVGAEAGAEAGSILQAARTALKPFIDEKKIELEYLSLADGSDMEEFDPKEKVGSQYGDGAVLSGAIRMLPVDEGQDVVRLIDNLIF